MRQGFVSVCLFGLAIVAASFVADDCGNLSWGTKTLYPAPATAAAKSPEGYEPVFVNYVGRHGARHATSNTDELLLQKIIVKAAAIDGVTEKGKALNKMVGNLLLIETKENLGLLTTVGKEEQNGIGKRMLQSYPGLFAAGNAHLRVVTTKQKRTKQSASALVKGLGFEKENPAIQWADNDSINLRFFEVAPGYRQFVKKRAWAAPLEIIGQSPKMKGMQLEILRLFFKENFIAIVQSGKIVDTAENGKIKPVDAAAIADAVYGCAGITKSIAKELPAQNLTLADIDVASLLTCAQLKALSFLNGAEDFLIKSPGMDANGIQVRDAAPLLVDMMNSTDSAIAHKNYTAILRFAHAETLSPIAALLEIDGAATATKKLENYEQVWPIGKVIPFSANLSWVLYQSKDGKKAPLVEILYNELPVKIQVATSQFPFYDWKDVKAFYTAMLKALHTAADADMYQYLQALK